MALAFPLPLTAFWSLLPVAEMTFDPLEQVEINTTGGGEILTSELAPQLWQGELRLGVMMASEWANLEPLIDLLRRPGASFYAHDTRRPGPRLDPTGTVLGAAAPVLASIGGNARDISLGGLPVGYTLSRGDYLAFDYLTRRALHRVVASSVAAGAGGATPVFEVVPALRPGAAVGAAVSLIRPSCKARMVPGSISKGASSATTTRDAAFSFTQSLR